MPAAETGVQTSRPAAARAGAAEAPSQAAVAGGKHLSLDGRFERLDHLLTLAITIAQDNAGEFSPVSVDAGNR